MSYSRFDYNEEPFSESDKPTDSSSHDTLSNEILDHNHFNESHPVAHLHPGTIGFVNHAVEMDYFESMFSVKEDPIIPRRSHHNSRNILPQSPTLSPGQSSPSTGFSSDVHSFGKASIASITQSPHSPSSPNLPASSPSPTTPSPPSSPHSYKSIPSFNSLPMVMNNGGMMNGSTGMPMPTMNGMNTTGLNGMQGVNLGLVTPPTLNMNMLNMSTGAPAPPPPPMPPAPQPPAQASASYGNETVTINGVVYNSRGYAVCGHTNQHSKPCQRIGRCPFHSPPLPPGVKDPAQSDPSEAAERIVMPTPKALTPPPPAPAPAPVPAVAPAPPQQQVPIISPVTNIPIPPPFPPPPVKKAPFKQGWTKEEHIKFLNGLQLHGKGAWKEIALIVGTRNATQIQSHAQKYFLRQKQENKNKRSIHDLSLEDIIEAEKANMVQDPSAASRGMVDMQSHANYYARQNGKDKKDSYLEEIHVETDKSVSPQDPSVFLPAPYRNLSNSSNAILNPNASANTTNSLNSSLNSSLNLNNPLSSSLNSSLSNGPSSHANSYINSTHITPNMNSHNLHNYSHNSSMLNISSVHNTNSPPNNSSNIPIAGLFPLDTPDNTTQSFRVQPPPPMPQPSFSSYNQFPPVLPPPASSSSSIHNMIYPSTNWFNPTFPSSKIMGIGSITDTFSSLEDDGDIGISVSDDLPSPSSPPSSSHSISSTSNSVRSIVDDPDNFLTLPSLPHAPLSNNTLPPLPLTIPSSSPRKRIHSEDDKLTPFSHKQHKTSPPQIQNATAMYYNW